MRASSRSRILAGLNTEASEVRASVAAEVRGFRDSARVSATQKAFVTTVPDFFESFDNFSIPPLGLGPTISTTFCYELVNLSLSYDSNLCVNYQAKSSSTEIQVKATISQGVNLLIEVECGRGRLEYDVRRL